MHRSQLRAVQSAPIDRAPCDVERKVLVCYEYIAFGNCLVLHMELFDRVAHRLKLRDVRLLHAVVKLKSMAKAAAYLNMSQPAVSKAVAQLEHVLGVKLLDRSRQGIAPTEYGQALLDCGAAMFDDLRQGVQRIEFLADPAAGEVRLGCHPFMAVSLVAAVVDRLSRSHPRIVFRLVIAEADKLLYELSERNVDLLITRKWSPIEDERMSFELLFEEIIHCRNRSPQSLGSAAENWAGRADGGSVDIATAGDWLRRGRGGSVSFMRPRLSSSDRRDQPTRGAHQLTDHWALSHDLSGFRPAISKQALRAQGVAH